MRRKHQHDDDDDAFDERGILKDGHVYRTSLAMMDSMDPIQQAVAQSNVRDGQGGTNGLSRPGFRLPTNDTEVPALDAAYAAYDQDLRESYRKNDQRGAQAGDAISEDDLGDAKPSDMATVYSAYDAEISQEWRRK